jgi:hypothetical protein
MRSIVSFDGRIWRFISGYFSVLFALNGRCPSTLRPRHAEPDRAHRTGDATQGFEPDATETRTRNFTQLTTYLNEGRLPPSAALPHPFPNPRQPTPTLRVPPKPADWSPNSSYGQIYSTDLALRTASSKFKAT